MSAAVIRVAWAICGTAMLICAAFMPTGQTKEAALQLTLVLVGGMLILLSFSKETES